MLLQVYSSLALRLLRRVRRWSKVCIFSSEFHTINYRELWRKCLWERQAGQFGQHRNDGWYMSLPKLRFSSFINGFIAFQTDHFQDILRYVYLRKHYWNCLTAGFECAPRSNPAINQFLHGSPIFARKSALARKSDIETIAPRTHGQAELLQLAAVMRFCSLIAFCIKKKV